ncbi:multiprotein-bridging factor 1 [Coemansia sp. RSA 486]|nr:multiprotein-bridging factor 1 [Coemansia sp. RSA 486]KAJ2598051.1 multiprotein-bridging factor 1 [Coemansia sp. RSA 1721]
MSDPYKPMVVHKPQVRTTAIKTSSQLNAAARAGGIVETQRLGSVMNKGHHVNTDHRRIAELDRSDDVKPPSTIKQTVSQTIQRVRKEKNWTQKELAQKVNEKDTVIRDYEAGKAVPNQQILARLERNLGVKLRGSDIGSVLPARGSKGKEPAVKK